MLASDKSANLFRETAFICLLRLARIHIQIRKLAEAADEFKRALGYSIDLRKEGPQFVSGGGGAYAQLKMMAGALQACSDEDVGRFFSLLIGKFPSETSIQA